METKLRLSDLKKKTPIRLAPDAEARKAIADRLGILAVKKLTFEGQLAPMGKQDWTLSAKLGATVVQPCVVTLDPVTTRLDETVERKFLADLPELPDASEVEMPEDDSVEPLPETLELSDVMEEALALALPDWPRAPGVEPVDIAVTEPGQTPLSNDDVKPFAALKTLQEKLKKDGSEET